MGPRRVKSGQERLNQASGICTSQAQARLSRAFVDGRVMGDVVNFTIRRNGYEWRMRVVKDWCEVVRYSGEKFSASQKDIGGPKLPPLPDDDDE